MEKPSFSKTCDVVSRYLKENKGTGDKSLFDRNKGMPMASASNINTVNLFPPMTHEITSMDLFPQHSGFGPSVSNQADHSLKEPVAKASQMTIIYGGQIFVFDEISADKAKEITLFASKTSCQDPSVFASAPIRKPIETSNTMGHHFVHNNNMLIERLNSSIATGLPLARTASLLRFLEKRKDRNSARAPYKTSQSKASPPKEDMKSWLRLSPQSPPQQHEHKS